MVRCSFHCFYSFKLVYFTGIPCDENGDYLPPGAPPPFFPDPPPTDWSPFKSRIHYETAELIYQGIQISAPKINNLLDLWAASLLKLGGEPLFTSHRDLYKTIDEAKSGDVPWKSFNLKYQGPIPDNSVPPSWMTDQFEVWYRDPHEVVKNMLANTDFVGEMDTTPFREYDGNGERRYHDFMSGDWAWQQAVSVTTFYDVKAHAFEQDIIAEDPETHGAMFVPIILGSDKTTVSVGTGHTEYHPLYAAIGNTHNGLRRAHRNALVVIGFLAIPQSMYLLLWTCLRSHRAHSGKGPRGHRCVSRIQTSTFSLLGCQNP
jgi:Plavaka transposase